MAWTEHDLRSAEAARVAGKTADKSRTAKRDAIVVGLLSQPGWTMERVAGVLNVSRSYINEINQKHKRKVGAMTDAQKERVKALLEEYGTAHVAEEYGDGGVHVVVNFGDDDERDFEVEPDGRVAPLGK